MKRYFGVLLAAGAVAACSSSSSPSGTQPPPPTTYTYSGTGAAPSSGQATAATDAQSNTQTIVSSAQAGSLSNNASQLTTTAPYLPSTLVGDVGPTGADRGVPPNNPEYSVIGRIAQATRNGELSTGCYTVSGNTVTYNNCDLSGTGYTITISGTMTATATNVTWSINANFNYSSGGDTLTETGTWSGNLNITGNATTGSISGTATEGFSVHEVAGSQTYDFAYTAQVTFNAVAWIASCTDNIDSGTMDLTVTVASSGSSVTGGYENFGIQFSWSGCGTVTVVRGTPAG